MRFSRRTFFGQVLLALLTLSAIQGIAQDRNPGIFQGYSAPPSSSMRFLASDAGKQVLLHSPSPMALPLLQRFHPDAVGQYPQQPMMQAGPIGGPRAPVTVAGCGTASGTVMNLEPALDAVAQGQPSVDFLLSELGSGKDLVVETGNDKRGVTGAFDSLSGVYVHRDPTVTCYGGTDFEMGNPIIADPLNPGDSLYSVGGSRVLADPNPAHKQFLIMDTRLDDTTSGIGLRRVPTSNFESTTTCPAGTLTSSQEATCIGTQAIIVTASLDNLADAPSFAQDPRTTGTGAGDIYIVNTSFRELRSVTTLTACKATFTTTADCSTPIIVSGSSDGTQFPSVAVVGGGPNAGAIAITYLNSDQIVFISCTPSGAPAIPVCGHHSTVRTDANLYASLTNNTILYDPWPVVAARTDTSGQTIFVVWSDCKAVFSYPLIGCADADVTMSFATNLASPSWTAGTVTGAAGHQFTPSIAYDSGQNVINIAYYSTGTDAYKNRVVMLARQILPGTTTVTGITTVTTSYDSTEGDGTSYYFEENPIGDFMGLAAHGGSASGSSRLYLGFTNNARLGTYGTITNTQADNNVSRLTY